MMRADFTDVAGQIKIENDVERFQLPQFHAITVLFDVDGPFGHLVHGLASGVN